MDLDRVLAEAYTEMARHCATTAGVTWEFSDAVWIALVTMPTRSMTETITGPTNAPRYRGIPIVITRNKGWALRYPGGVVTENMTPTGSRIDWGLREEAIF